VSSGSRRCGMRRTCSGSRITACAFADRDVARSAAVVSFSRNDLVVESSEWHAEGCPGIKMTRGSDSSGTTFRLADGPVLVKGRSTLDGWLVDTLALVDVVGTSVANDGSLMCQTRSWVIGTEVLKDVVFN